MNTKTTVLLKKVTLFFCSVCLFACACALVACGQMEGNTGGGDNLKKLYLFDAKTDFWEGERFSSDGLSVVGEDENGLQDEVTDFNVDSSEYNSDKAGEYVIKVSAGGATEEYKVTVMASWKKDGELKILTIGNSFSDDATGYLYDIATSAGIEKVKLGNLYIGGCSLETHLNNAANDSPAYEYRVCNSDTKGVWKTTTYTKMGDAIDSENWDFITFQQASGFSGVKNSYEPLSALEDYVRMHNETAKFGWHMTWAYQQNSDHPDFSRYGNDQITMYNAIVSAVKEKVLVEERIKFLVPSGTAIQNARTSVYGDKFTRDGYHLTYDFGRYIAGLTLFSAITDVPVDDVIFVAPGLVKNQETVAKAAAKAALNNPLEVTSLKEN